MTQHPNVFNTTAEEFQSDVLDASHTRPILLDMWADWCPPCTTLTPILERVVKGLDGAVGLAKLEVDDGKNMKIAGQYNARGFPTVILFQNGEERGRFSGAQPPSMVENFIKQHAVL